MIGFDHIGTMGRLGNQMFQYAALKGIAAHRGYEYTIPPENPRIQIDNYGLIEAFELSDNKKIGWLNTQYDIIAEKHFHFDEDLFNTFPDGSGLYGFFQSEKYFKHIEDEIREDFTFKKEWLEPCEGFRKDLGDEVIFLHVRRGDPNLADKRGFKWAYTQCSSQHPPQPLEYYEKALKEFDDDMPVVVFSDSIDWVKEQDLFKPDRFMISEQTDKFSDGALVPYIDLCLMTLCDHAIIANSSMSWWGAWLIQNEYKKVVAPKMWFGPAYADKDTKDLYPKGCIVI
jgi:hypothetical protein|tara:strand:- start:871 stop:1725 length:855 start_codon:yes stop_codon:yes gene_type:complete